MTSGTSDNSDIVIGALRELANRGAAVVISSHDQRVIYACDGVVQLVALPREQGSHATISCSPDGSKRFAEAAPAAQSVPFGFRASSNARCRWVGRPGR